EWGGRNLSKGKFATGGSNSGAGWSPDFGISHGNICGASELSHPQPDFERDVGGCACGGRSRVFGHTNYGRLRSGTESRRVRGAGQCNQQKLMGTEYAD